MPNPTVRLAVTILVLAAAVPAAAQPVFAPREELGFDRPEAWALNYFGSVTLLSALGAPRAEKPGSVELGLELGWIPHLDAEQRTVGFGGLKEEDLNRSPVFARPRLTVGLPAGFSATLAWAPPVEIDGVESNLVAVAFGRPLWTGESWTLGARVLGQTGSSKGAFTCTSEDAAGGADPAANPFGCEAESDDEATLRYAAFELTGGYRSVAGWSAYLSGAAVFVDHEFQVDALTFGFRDRTLLTVDGSTYTLAAGADLPLADRIRFAGEVLYAPLSVHRIGADREDDPMVNARLMLAYRLR